MTDVDRIQGELSAITALVRLSGGPSDIVSTESVSAKVLLLSAASHFERAVCELIISVAKYSGTKPAYQSFIDKQALERRYHSMFDWNAKNINKFFGLFGQDIRERLSDAVNKENMADAMRDFLYLGAQRNLLVHENFAGFSLDATTEEIYARYLSALSLIEWIGRKLTDEVGLDQAEVELN